MYHFIADSRLKYYKLFWIALASIRIFYNRNQFELLFILEIFRYKDTLGDVNSLKGQKEENDLMENMNRGVESFISANHFQYPLKW